VQSSLEFEKILVVKFIQVFYPGTLFLECICLSFDYFDIIFILLRECFCVTLKLFELLFLSIELHLENRPDV